ncbi:hypothetical protein ACTFIY_007660 [Dictyostelium cf. discoideum]
MQQNSSCYCAHCQTIIKEINKKDNVNLKKHEKQPNDIGKIKFWPDQAIYWRGVFDGFDYIIFGVAVAAFSNINMSYFWATILTIGLNFFILFGRQALMCKEYDLKKFEGRLSIESSYFNALASVDSVYGNKIMVLIVVIIGMFTCTTGLIVQALIYQDSFQTPYFFWEPSSDFQFNPIFNMFAMNFLNLFCAFLSLCFYFKLIGCVGFEIDGAEKSLFYYSPCEETIKKTVIVKNENHSQLEYNSVKQNKNYNQQIFYNPNKLELVMILLEKDHLNKFVRECRKNRVHLELVFNKSETDRICGL